MYSCKKLFFSQIKGSPHQKAALELYNNLRKALIDNVIKQYENTGYVWEQYNDRTGNGQGCRPFTGWSALVVLMMGENY
jgi:mannosyl-oligosaccharide glucosidase